MRFPSLETFYVPEIDAYRFPTVHDALMYLDEMTDDECFVIENKDDWALLNKFRRMFA